MLPTVNIQAQFNIQAHIHLAGYLIINAKLWRGKKQETQIVPLVASTMSSCIADFLRSFKCKFTIVMW